MILINRVAVLGLPGEKNHSEREKRFYSKCTFGMSLFSAWTYLWNTKDVGT